MINKEIKTQIRSQTAGYIAGALGLVAGLAWGDAIKALIEDLFPFAKSGLLAKFIYAVLVTLIVVIVSRYLFKSSTSEKK